MTKNIKTMNENKQLPSTTGASMKVALCLLSYKRIRLLFLALFVSTFSYAQTAKKPTIMILPSDNWCVQRYFTQEFSNQGQTVRIPNYQQAFQEDIEIGAVISKVGGLLTGLGYSIKDAEQGLKTLATREAEDNVTMSKTSGASLSETPLDILKRRLKSDIVIQIGWNLNREANGRSATFNIEAFDCYTNKRIASSTSTTNASNDPIAVILEQGVKQHI